MDSVNDLHKKFEDLNEEISAALRVQQDVVASVSTFSGRANLTAARKDALRLAKKTTDWRGDVTALSKHIDLQLQHSRALRSHYAQSLLSSSAQKQQEEAEGSRLRCLRSDLRLLQDFRVQYVRQCGENDLAPLTAIEEETKQLKAFIDKSAKKEKMGGKQEQSVLALELFEVRRDIMSRISEDLVKEKKQLDIEVGNPEALANDSFGNSNNATAEKDALASWDTQLYALHELQKEKRERLAVKSRNSVVSFTGVEGLAMESKAASPTKASSELKTEMLVEDVHFTMQKLKREVAELKVTNSKLMITNSQLEDDVAHLQAKFDEEKRAHLNGKKWFVPKMQKLEDLMLNTSKAFEEVKLSVELMTNMYKQLNSTLALQQDGEDELKRERDQVSVLLAGEIKKIAALTKEKKENERKDRLVTFAMAARYEMVQLANRQEKLAKEACAQRDSMESRAQQAEAELVTNKQQLEEAFERLEATNATLSSAKESIVQLQGEVRATAKAAAAKEVELLAAFEKQQAALQQKLDKTKRELMESMSEMLSLDSRLRKAQEKLTKQATDATTS